MGIKNINPPTNRIKVIPDEKPQLMVSIPDNNFEINDNRLIEFDIQIVDDFGIGSLWIEYNIKKPSYLNSDTTTFRYNINNIASATKAQRLTSQLGHISH